MMTEGFVCPKCRKPGGSVQRRWTKNAYGQVYRYWYVGHYRGLETSKNGKRYRDVKWCYLGKNPPGDVGGLGKPEGTQSDPK